MFTRLLLSLCCLAVLAQEVFCADRSADARAALALAVARPAPDASLSAKKSAPCGIAGCPCGCVETGVCDCAAEAVWSTCRVPGAHQLWKGEWQLGYLSPSGVYTPILPGDRWGDPCDPPVARPRPAPREPVRLPTVFLPTPPAPSFIPPPTYVPPPAPVSWSGFSGGFGGGFRGGFSGGGSGGGC